MIEESYLSALELRISELETRVRAFTLGGGLAVFSSGSCTNNCTAACTIAECTNGCGAARREEIVRLQSSAEHGPLESDQNLAGNREIGHSLGQHEGQTGVSDCRAVADFGAQNSLRSARAGR